MFENEFDKQKFLETVKNIFVKKKRTTRDKQIIRQFFKICKSWSFWQKITKSSDKLLDLLIESFILVEHDIDTPLQIKGNSQEKFVILLIQGFIEVRYECENPSFAAKELQNSLQTESKFTELESSMAESMQSERSPQSLKFNQKRKPTSNQQNKKKDKNELIQQNKEILKDVKGKEEYFKYFSSTDLDYVEVKFTNQNKKKINEKYFQSSKLYRKVIDDDNNQQIIRSKTVEYGSKNQKETPFISLSTKFETGDVMNKYLFFEREIDYDQLTYVAQSDISFITLDSEQIEKFMLSRTEYLKKYDQFLDQFLSSESLPSPLEQQEIEYLKEIYILNERVKQGDKVIQPFNHEQQNYNKSEQIQNEQDAYDKNEQIQDIQNEKDLQYRNENILIDNYQQSDKNELFVNDVQEQQCNFYLIKEGFFDLQVAQQKNKYVSIQNQYSFIGNELNQKQIIIVQNKRHNEQFNTVAMLQKGQIFGEEIIFNQNNKYSYCVIKKTPYSELIQFQFQKPEKIPPSLFQFILQQYKEKKSIQIENDQEEVEEENEQQISITAKYNSQNPILYGNYTDKIHKDSVVEQNINQYQIDMTANINRQTANGFFQINPNKDSQKQVKKIVLNEQLNQQLNYQVNKTFMQERNRNQEAVWQGFNGEYKINDRCQSGRNNIYKDYTQEDDESDINLPKPMIPTICRKNQFVKKNKLIERPNSPILNRPFSPIFNRPFSPNQQRPKTSNSQSPQYNRITSQTNPIKNQYLPPIHVIAKFDENQFYELNKNLVNNQQNTINHQVNSTNVNDLTNNQINQQKNQINETTINYEINQTNTNNNETNVQNYLTNHETKEYNYQTDEINFEMNATNYQINQQSLNKVEKQNKINQRIIKGYNPSDKQVKTIKIQFDSSEEGSKDSEDMGLNQQKYLDKSQSFQSIHSNFSPIKQRGELFRGRSLNKFNKIIQNNTVIGFCGENREQDEYREIEDRNQINQECFNQQFNFDIKGTKDIAKTSPLTQRVITDGLKGSKIKKTPFKDKEKKDENQKKSEQIKHLYQIEHEKQVQQQLLKSQMLIQMQQISSQNIRSQKFIRQRSQDHLNHNKYNQNSFPNKDKYDFKLKETSPKQRQVRNDGSSPISTKTVQKISINSLSRPQLAQVKGNNDENITNKKKNLIDQKAKTDQNFYQQNKKSPRFNINESQKPQEKKNKSHDKSKDKNREMKRNSQNTDNIKQFDNKQDKIESNQKHSQRAKSLERGANLEKSHSNNRKNKEFIKEEENKKQNQSKKIIDEEEKQVNTKGKKQRLSNNKVISDEDIDKNQSKNKQKQSNNEIKQKDINKDQQSNVNVKSKQHKKSYDKDQKDNSGESKQKGQKKNHKKEEVEESMVKIEDFITEKDDKKKQKQQDKAKMQNENLNDDKKEKVKKEKQDIKQVEENTESKNDKRKQINQIEKQENIQKHSEKKNKKNDNQNENDMKDKEQRKQQIIISKKQKKTQNQQEESDDDNYPSPKQRNVSKGKVDKNEKIFEMKKAYQGDQKYNSNQKQGQLKTSQDKSHKDVSENKNHKDASQDRNHKDVSDDKLKKQQKKEVQTNQENKHKIKDQENQEQIKQKNKSDKQLRESQEDKQNQEKTTKVKQINNETKNRQNKIQDEEEKDESNDENKTLKNIIKKIDVKNKEETNKEKSQSKNKEERKQSKLKEDLIQKKELNDSQIQEKKNRPMSPQQRHQKIKDLNEKIQQNQNEQVEQNGKIISKLKKIVQTDNGEPSQNFQVKKIIKNNNFISND